jgi:hypothetical protein
MDERNSELNMAHAETAASPSIEALAASLKAMEGMMGELTRTLGSLRPSGIAPAAAEASAAPEPLRPRMAAEPRPGRSDIATRPTRGRSLMRSSAARDGDLLVPAACCDACAAREARQLVYALGRLGYDFGTEARMDSIQSQMDVVAAQEPRTFSGGKARASNPGDIVSFLKSKQGKPVSPAITWTLVLNETPIYAIRPEGDYLEETYEALVDTLDEQTRTFDEARAVEAANKAAAAKESKARPKPVPPVVERMSLPGVVNGEVELMNGLVIPTVRPALAGMFTWSTEELIKALAALPTAGVANDPGKPGAFNPLDGLRTFLSRIYEEMRNVGLAPQDRALNYAATNAYQANEIFVKLRGRNIHIEKFEVVRSPVMRPDSDCWDVKMTFYNPADISGTPREVYFYTIDVSDVVPVAIGAPRHWTTY